jgi:hypothetical protein
VDAAQYKEIDYDECRDVKAKVEELMCVGCPHYAKDCGLTFHVFDGQEDVVHSTPNNYSQFFSCVHEIRERLLGHYPSTLQFRGKYQNKPTMEYW